MYIDVVFSPCELEPRGEILDKTAVVIDVLRATTSIAYAFWGYRDTNISETLGCYKVIPLESVEEAKDIAKKYYKTQVVLAGERNCLKIEDFDLGNSPSDFAFEKIQGKTVIFTTTNGTRALKKVEQAKFVTTASFVNASACANRVFQAGDDVLILCSGRTNKTAKEDTTCAGLIVDLLIKRCQESGKKFELSDSADIAVKYFDYYKNDIYGMLESSEAGKNLIDVGLKKDLNDCCLIDILSIATVYKDGFIKIF